MKLRQAVWQATCEEPESALSSANRPDRAFARGPVLAAWAALGSFFCYRISSTVVDPDLFHQLALIREWRSLGAFPRVDLYAFTPTIRPFMHHEWGAGVIAYGVATTLGGAGILSLRYALGLALALVTVRAALRSGAPPLVVAFLAPVAIALAESGYSPLRAHAYSFLFAALALDLCDRDRARESRWLWALVPLFAAWVNIHAGFVLGAVLVAAHAAERAAQRGSLVRIGLVLVAVTAVVALNPYGLDYYAHIVRSLGAQRTLVSEWVPIWSAKVPLQQKLAFGAAVGLVGYGLTFGRGSTRNGVLVMAVAAALSAKHFRMLPFFAVAWLMYCPALLRGTLLQACCQRVSRSPRAFAGVCVVFALAAGAMIWVTHPLHLRVPNDPRPGDPDAAPYYPVGAVAYLQAQRFRGNLLTPFNQGSYVLWRLYPTVKVSLDSRYEAVYEQTLVEELTRVYQSGEGLPETMAKYGADAVLVPRRSGLARARIPLRKVYEDASFTLYARRESSLEFVDQQSTAADVFP